MQRRQQLAAARLAGAPDVAGAGCDGARFRLLAAVLCVMSLVLGAGAVGALRFGTDLPAQLNSALHRVTPVTADRRQAEIADLLRERYYRPVDAALLAKTAPAALPGLLDDPYTRYLDPGQLSAFERGDDGRYAGIGVHAQLVNNEIVLDRVSSGSPAAAARLRPGDVLLSADGRGLHGPDLEAALNQIRGPIGSTVQLQVRRNTRTFTAAVPRKAVAAQIVSHELRTIGGQPVGYIQVLEFSRGVGQQTRAAVRDLQASGARGVVLDLRHNGGGLVDEAVALTAVFTASGTVVFSETGSHVPTSTYRTHAAPAAGTLPVAVLVDAQTASAAEIVTGALRDAGRAEVVGTRTFGKGVIQNLAPLPGGGALKYTMAEYVTPRGEHVNRRGISPDLPVPAQAGAGGPDSALAAAARSVASRAGTP